MNKPVICFDFDGTLVDRHGIIHPRDVDILRHEDRVTFIPATGRLLRSVRHAFDRNGLFLNGPIRVVRHQPAVSTDLLFAFQSGSGGYFGA